MAMNNETAGERVFGNVDEALAERIVSRALENSKEPESAYDAGAGRVDAGSIDTDKSRQRWSQAGYGSIVKILIPAALVLVALWGIKTVIRFFRVRRRQ